MFTILMFMGLFLVQILALNAGMGIQQRIFLLLAGLLLNIIVAINEYERSEK